MFDGLFNGLAWLLAFYYSLIPNYAVAIILLTLTVMIVLFPLTAKGTRSMTAMQRLQPEMKRLQAKHKNDRQKLNEEMMTLYKEHGVNPLAGCLPLILQMPVFLVLYNVLHGMTRIRDGVPDPKYLDHGSQLYRDIVADNGTMEAFGFDLANKAIPLDAHSSFWAALPFFLLIGLMIGAQYYQQRQLNARNPEAAANPQAQMLQRVFPAFFGLISLNIQAGVVLYWFVSNLFRIGQQSAMYRFDPSLRKPITSSASVKGPEDAKGAKQDGGAGKPGGGKGQVIDGKAKDAPRARGGASASSEDADKPAPKRRGGDGGDKGGPAKRPAAQTPTRGTGNGNRTGGNGRGNGSGRTTPGGSVSLGRAQPKRRKGR